MEKDLEAARKWYQKAAVLGNVQCLSELGNAYLTGSGVPKDVNQGIALLEAAACRGNYSAQKDLGILYYNGKKVSKDHTKALYWLEKAVALGSGEAMEILSRMYRDGDGVEKSEAEALKWLKNSAEKNYPFGCAALGFCCETGGLGCEIDLSRAIELYKKAAEGRSMRGRYELGRCYLKGIGIDRNREEAFKFLGIAVASGKDELKYYQKAAQLVADMYFENGDFKTNEAIFISINHTILILVDE